jgi:hypothetical protein
MGVEMGRDLTCQQRQQRLQLTIPYVFASGFFGGVTLCFFQRAAHNGGYSHTGHRLTALAVAVVALVGVIVGFVLGKKKK